MQTIIPFSVLSSLVLASDGLSLGVKNLSLKIRELCHASGVNSLSVFRDRRMSDQRGAYETGRRVSTLNPFDDLVAGCCQFTNALEGTELGGIIFESQIETILRDFLLPWQKKAINLWRTGLTDEEIARELQEEGFGNIGRATSLRGVTRRVRLWLDYCEEFDPQAEIERISSLEKMLEPVYALLYCLNSFRSYGWTYQLMTERLEETHGVSLSARQVRARIDTALQEIEKSHHLSPLR